MQKFISAICIFSMLLMNTAPAQAVDSDSEELCKGNTTITFCPDGISADTVNDIKESVCAFVSNTDGTKYPVDCKVAISEIAPVVTRNVAEMVTDESKTYAIEVTAIVDEQKKSTPNASGYNVDGISASATITMIWTDRFGTDNSIDGLSGHLDIESGTFSNGLVRWGSYHNQCKKYKNINSLSWQYDIYYRPSQEGIGNLGALHAEYQNWFTNGKSFTVCVSPTHLS